MSSYLYLPLLISCLFLFTSCDRSSKVTGLENRITALEAELESLKSTVTVHDLGETIDHLAYLTPGSEGYSVVRFDLGYLTVGIDNIQPYANGSKVTFRFGNLTAATIVGLKAKLEWGSVNKEGVPNNPDAKSRNIALKENLKSGRWTHSTIILEGVPPTELGFVRLKEVGHRGILLSQ